MERLRVAALDRDAALAQRVDDAFEQRLRQPGQRLDRQFFGAQFDEQGGGVGHRSKASCLGVLPFNGGGFALKSSPSRGGFRWGWVSSTPPRRAGTPSPPQPSPRRGGGFISRRFRGLL